MESRNYSSRLKQPRASTGSPQLDFNTMSDTQETKEFLSYVVEPNAGLSCLGDSMSMPLQSFNITPSSSSSFAFSSPGLSESAFPSPNLSGSAFSSPNLPGSAFSSPNLSDFEVLTPGHGSQIPQICMYNSTPYNKQLNYSLQTASCHGMMIPNIEAQFPNFSHRSSWQGSGSINGILPVQGQLTGKYDCWCGKKFDPKHGSGNLSRHKKSVHTPEAARDEKLKCEHCGKSFSRMDGKMVHYQRMHRDENCRAE